MQRGWQWPVLITAALLFTVGVNVVMLFAAGADPNGTAVEPDYYRKAVEWDRTMARQAASEALGWQATATFALPSAAGRDLEVALRDRDGQPIRDADLHVTLIHNLEASHPLEVGLAARDGRYAATLRAIRSGRWEVRVEARRGTERFSSTLHAEAP